MSEIPAPSLSVEECLRRLLNRNKNVASHEIESRVSASMRNQNIPFKRRRELARFHMTVEIPIKKTKKAMKERKSTGKEEADEEDMGLTSDGEYDLGRRTTSEMTMEMSMTRAREQEEQKREKEERRRRAEQLAERNQDEEIKRKIRADKQAKLRAKKEQQQQQQKKQQQAGALVASTSPPLLNQLWEEKYSSMYHSSSTSHLEKFLNWLRARYRSSDPTKKSTGHKKNRGNTKPICLIRGPTGCGKSILVKQALSMFHPTRTLAMKVFGPGNLRNLKDVEEQLQPAMYCRGFTRQLVVIDSIEHLDVKDVLPAVVRTLVRLCGKDVGRGARGKRAGNKRKRQSLISVESNRAQKGDDLLCANPVILTSGGEYHYVFKALEACCFCMKLYKVPDNIMSNFMRHILHSEHLPVPRNLQAFIVAANGNLRGLVNQIQFHMIMGAAVDEPVVTKPLPDTMDDGVFDIMFRRMRGKEEKESIGKNALLNDQGMDHATVMFGDLFRALGNIRFKKKYRTLENIEKAMEFHSTRRVAHGVQYNILESTASMDVIARSCDAMSDYDILGYHGTNMDMGPACVLEAVRELGERVQQRDCRMQLPPRMNPEKVQREANFKEAMDVACIIRRTTALSLLEEVSMFADLPISDGPPMFTSSHMFTLYHNHDLEDDVAPKEMYKYGQLEEISEEKMRGMHKLLYRFSPCPAASLSRNFPPPKVISI